MRSITVSVPDQVYRLAWVRAAERGQSVNALVADYLGDLSGGDAEFTRLPGSRHTPGMGHDHRPGSVQDVHRVAQAMPHVTIEKAGANPVYQVGRKSFVFFRNPRKDAVDAGTGERYDDVIVIWVGGEDDKEALVQDPDSPFFTTPHFAGHPSVLVRASRIGEVTWAEITELVQEAWLSQASRRRATDWLAGHGLSAERG